MATSETLRYYVIIDEEGNWLANGDDTNYFPHFSHKKRDAFNFKTARDAARSALAFDLINFEIISSERLDG